MESEAAKIRKLYDDGRNAAIEKLQSKCGHPSRSKWIDEWWAPGHSTGYQVVVCKRCEKELHRRTDCNNCGKIIIDDKIVKGTMENGAPIGGAYCSACIPKVAARAKEFVRKVIQGSDTKRFRTKFGPIVSASIVGGEPFGNRKSRR